MADTNQEPSDEMKPSHRLAAARAAQRGWDWDHPICRCRKCRVADKPVVAL